MKRNNISDKFKKKLVGYTEDLFRYALFLCRNNYQAEDLVSDTLLIALEKSNSLRDEAKIKSWLFKILTNQYLSEKRKEKKQISLQDASKNESFSLYEHLKENNMVSEESPEKGFINKILKDDLQKAIDNLPEKFKQAVILNDIEEMSYTEIAVIMNIKIGTVRSRIARGRALLQKKLWYVAKEMGIKSNFKKSKIICDCGEIETVQSLPKIL